MDRVLRSRRQGGSRFISEEEEERLRRNVEERRKVAGRGLGFQGRARKDRAEERQDRQSGAVQGMKRGERGIETE